MSQTNDFLYIVDLKHARDVDVERGISEPSWEDFRNSLMHHRFRKNKDGEAFLPVMMKPESEWELKKSKTSDIEHYRFDVNIEAISTLVIDIDKPGALEAAEQLFDGFEYVVYSTHNFTPETPWKYRLVARLAEPIMIEDWQMCFEALKSRIEIDPSCCNPSRCYYYPSHSINSHISPRSFYRLGRAITRDEILDMASSEMKLNPSALRMRTIGTRPIHQVRARRHFSGKVVASHERLPSVLESSTIDYELRHAKSIQDYLKDDSRHNLALSITSREYYMLGPRTELRSLLAFLYQTAEQGSKALQDGNTPDELPDIIVSAMQKYAPEAYEKMIELYGEKSMIWIAEEISWAEKNYKYGRQIERGAQEPADAYQIYRNRHAQWLREYVENGDLTTLVTRIAGSELSAPKPNYKDLAGAIIRYCNGYLSKVVKLDDAATASEMKSQIRAAAEAIKNGDGEARFIEGKKLTHLRSALLVELTKQNNKDENFSYSPS